MRLAFISDIHGYLPALKSVLADIAGRGVDATYHLGDLVGYGPWPNEVIERIRDEGIAGIAGNYDTTVALGHDTCGCQHTDPRDEALSTASYRWTVAQVTPRNRRFLAGLPFGTPWSSSGATEWKSRSPGLPTTCVELRKRSWPRDCRGNSGQS